MLQHGNMPAHSAFALKSRQFFDHTNRIVARFGSIRQLPLPQDEVQADEDERSPVEEIHRKSQKVLEILK